MIPAYSFGVVGCGRCRGGGASCTATAVAQGATATAVVVVDSVLGERNDEVRKAPDFRLERLYLRGGLRDSSNGRCCYFDDLVCHVRKLGEVGGIVCRGEDVRWETLEEELLQKGVVVRHSAEVIAQQLLHAAKELRRFSVAEFFATNELL